MNDVFGQTRSIPTGRADMAVDAGLRSFMLGVYNKMALGLVLSAALAFVVGTNAQLSALVFGTPLRWVVMFGPIGLLLISAFVMRNPSPMAANAIYWSVVSLIGVGMGAIVIVYGNQPGGMLSVAKAFFTTAAAFGALSLWGYTTKRDLSGLGVFLIMGVVGLIIASVVNMFLNSGPLGFAISVIGVAVFGLLTAFDTQRLKYSYYELVGNERMLAVATTFGALSLYINFVNMFQFILSIMAPRD
ncbi:MAG: Bax inhibitor-1/YccA family protein [Caulobacterales bacterium]|jgi:FtsH-binding integral membrane protein